MADRAFYGQRGVRLERQEGEWQRGALDGNQHRVKMLVEVHGDVPCAPSAKAWGEGGEVDLIAAANDILL